MPDFDMGQDDWYRQALRLNGSPIGGPTGFLPGQAAGVLGTTGGTPAGNSGPPQYPFGLQPGWLTDFLKRHDPYDAYKANKAAGEAAGGSPLDRLNAWANQSMLGGVTPPQPQPNPQLMAMGQQPSAIPTSPPAPPPQMPQGDLQSVSFNEPGAPRRPTQAVTGFPDTAIPGGGRMNVPAIPPASAQGRTQAAQGDPLDKFYQQMMALQRQRMLLGMAGGLLGAPSFGQGLGRAFTNASETMAPQGDLVSRIAGAQAAGQLTAQQPHSTKEDVQASQLQALFGKPFEPPRFEKYEHGTFGIKPGGRMYDTTTGYSTWVHGHRGLDHNGNSVPVSQAATADLGNGHTAVLLDDHKWHDAYHPTEEGSER